MSENIFTKLYNNILGLFGQSAPKEESKNTAVNRLRLVLMQDRTNLTPEIMHKMRTELIAVLSKYVELDKEALELNFEQEGEQMALMLSIPVIRAKDEEEIAKALEEAENKEEVDEEDSEEKTEETSEDNESPEQEAVEENLSEEQPSEGEAEETITENENGEETSEKTAVETEEQAEEPKEEKPKKKKKTEE